jgi:hypothetical protein
MTPCANPIQHSFELAAERCEDLTPLVYARLFREHPEAEPMFRSQGSDLVKGSMLALTIDAMLDFAGDRTGHFRLIECEVQSHDAYGTPRELFGAFFGVIAQTLREISRGRLVTGDRRGVAQVAGGDRWRGRAERNTTRAANSAVILRVWFKKQFEALLDLHVKTNLLNRINVIWAVQSHLQNILIFRRPKSVYNPCRPRPTKRGVSRSSRT